MRTYEYFQCDESHRRWHPRVLFIREPCTVTLKQTECRKRNKKIAAAVYLYQADNDGEWGEIRFDFENGTAKIVKLADWDTVKSNIFAKMAIRYIQSLPEARLLKSVVVPFEMKRIELV